MPLSDHEQRMLDQIESALYAEDPKFASSVRGGGLRAPTARRRLQGVALFVIGLGDAGFRCRVSGPPWIGTLPDPQRCRLHRDVRRCGVRDHRPARLSGRGDRADQRPALRASVATGARADRSPVAWRIGSAAASTNKRSRTQRGSHRLPRFCVCLGAGRITTPNPNRAPIESYRPLIPPHFAPPWLPVPVSRS